jgi:hypothetical protein
MATETLAVRTKCRSFDYASRDETAKGSAQDDTSHGYGLVPPEFGGEEAGEAMLTGDAGQAELKQGRSVVGKCSGAEVGDDTEGEVEAADEESGGEFCEVGGDAEVREEPEGGGLHFFCDAGDDGVQFGLGEAVEEEVRDGEVVGVFERESEGVGLLGAQAMSGVGDGRFAALTEELEHGGAGVDREDMDVRVGGEERGSEAAVSVAEDQRVAAVAEFGQIVETSYLEGGAEGQVFEPAVGFCDEIEVRFGLVHRWRNGSRRIGVVRARSAAARRVMGSRV